MEHKVIIDGVEYVPKSKEEEDQTRGLTDKQLESRSLFDLDKHLPEKHEYGCEWP